MGTFNYYGLIFIAVIMIPNVLFAIFNRNGFENKYKNKTVEALEQIGRFGCFLFMIVNIPYTYLNFWFDGAKTVYLVVNGVLIGAYLLIWAICWKKDGVFKSLALSLLPSAVFVFSAIMLLSIPLFCLSLVFAPTHVLLSYKNATAD